MAVLALALAVRVLNLWLVSRLPVAEYQFHWAESDMAASWAWSGRIISGDILGRDTPHQYTSWMREWAPLETWERWWGGRTVFHQAPLYAYALAAMRLVAGDGFWGIGLCQAMLGVANVALVYLLAARLFGGAVPVIAALGAALYGPFLLHETLVLRDTLGVTVSLLLLWWLAGCDDARALPWLVAGWLFALALLAREATLVFGPFVALWIARRFGRHPRALATVALAFVAGVSVGLAPLVARNVVVGAPPLSLSTRGIEAFVYGNAADSAVIGLTLPAASRSILEQADGRLGTAIRLTLATYQGDWLRLVGNELFKLRAIFARYEPMDNVNWYYFADRSPLLRFSLHFESVLALGLVGLWLDRQRAVRHRLLRYFLLASAGALMYSTIVGRYRLPAVAVLLLYAGVTVEWTAREVAAGRWRRAAIAGLAAVGVAAASAHLLPSAERRQRYRADEFLLAAEVHYRHGRAERALEELRAGLDTAYGGPDQQTLPGGYPNLAVTFTRLAHELGRDADAAAALERVAASHPADGELERIIGFVYRDGLGRTEEAEKHFTRARTLAGS
ncbi:MAG: glycosyltransferase family 39 protein [Deltaproteobacteria bacterium]|nr:MAG: glycosyltransferase family 39 protein [Deltaproteobacteria bacterium]